MAKTTSDLIVERLLDWGIDTCFGLNGDAINGFFEALRTHADRMRFVHVRHEENAALAAVGYAKFTGRPAACVATAGPGAVHLLNGLYDAEMDGVPVIAITGMTYHDVIGAHLLQDLNSDYLFRDACAFSERVMGPAHAVNATDLAVRKALAAHAPAHLAIPVDTQAQTEDTHSPKNPPGHTSTAMPERAPAPSRGDLEQAAETLNSCGKVVIVAGAGARGCGDELERVADLLAAPIVKAGLGKDVVPDDSPYTTGGMGIIGTRPSHEAMEQCDGLLIVGSATAFHEFWPKPDQARGVQIDRNPARIGLRYPVESGLVGDARTALIDLMPLLRRKSDRAFLEHAQAGMRRWWDVLREEARDHSTPMRPQTITWELSELLPDNAIVTGDAGTVTAWAGRLRLRRGMNYSFSGTHCTMGSAVPYAIGAKIAHPERPVIAFNGDGAMSMGLGELATLAQYALPVTVIVLHNNSLALEVWEQNALLGNPQYGCDLHSIDFAKVAEGCGLRAFRIEKTEEAHQMLAEAIDHNGPSLVECVVDPYAAPYTDTIKDSHADKILAAYEKGEPEAPRMARSLLEPARLPMAPAVQHAEHELRRYT
ncbi:thiamine pyrophosphate-dependent enzyme [Amycolatopsis pithecellobii]|uniref:Pyruvate oxidase n=1 Tax=Amycolatopsis pithecellobii TaxID=664692 RepID=A0A6N7Z0G4_9PSEU|nr:thiamine pyrophosphate-dependent enzyme [Amycolatopsis pithecellobii]MTD52934.1 pyruvate oxidase [Amycolatopsis pithecellobii]